jgi:hypothetical protein
MSFKFVKYKKNKNNYLTGLQYSNNKEYIFKGSRYNFADEPTIIEKGFKKVTVSKKEQLDNFNSNFEILSKLNNQYKQIQKETKGYKSYVTIFNGQRCFMVYVNKSLNRVKIYKVPDNVSFIVDSNEQCMFYKWQYVELVKDYKNLLNVFIGKSPKTIDNKCCKSSFGSHLNGNNILIQKTSTTYILISTNLHSFTSKSQIHTFVSPMENNEVPCPYAISDKYLFYFSNMLKYKLTPFIKSKVFLDRIASYIYGNAIWPVDEKQITVPLRYN